jgi:hypothetical protein
MTVTGIKGNEVAGNRRKLNNDKVQNYIYLLIIIIIPIQDRELGGIYSTRVEMRNL